jgi:type 1 fimbria pilin
MKEREVAQIRRRIFPNSEIRASHFATPHHDLSKSIVNQSCEIARGKASMQLTLENDYQSSQERLNSSFFHIEDVDVNGQAVTISRFTTQGKSPF